MIRQCAILFGCLALGELIVFFTGIKLPSSIIGMLLLTLFLKLGWIKLHWVQGMSDFLDPGAGYVRLPGCQPGLLLRTARCSSHALLRCHRLRVLADSDRFHNQHPAGDCSHRMGSSTNT